MFGLEIIDIIVIFVYFAAMLYIGFRAMKHIKSQEDYFMGGRRFKADSNFRHKGLNKV